MLSWISPRERSKPLQPAPVMKRSGASTEDSVWYSPNQSLFAIEVKELSIAEFMAVYKPQLNKG